MAGRMSGKNLGCVSAGNPHHGSGVSGEKILTSSPPRVAAKHSRKVSASRKIKVGGVKKARRSKPGAVALREIRKYQKTTELLLRKEPFVRLVLEVAQNLSGNELPVDEKGWTRDALIAVQESAEAFLIVHFEMLLRCAMHAKRVTIQKEDNDFLLRLLSIARASIGGYYMNK